MERFCSGIRYGNCIAVQFHLKKSSKRFALYSNILKPFLLKYLIITDLNGGYRHTDLETQIMSSLSFGALKVKAIDLRTLRSKSGYIGYDEGYGNTGSCESAITFINGEKV